MIPLPLSPHHHYHPLYTHEHKQYLHQPYIQSFQFSKGKIMDSSLHSNPQPSFQRSFDAGSAQQEGKGGKGQFVSKIDRIYSNDSNIETAEESLYEYNDAIIQIDSSPPAQAKFQKQFSMLEEANHPILQFRKYESDLIKTIDNAEVLKSDMERQITERPAQLEHHVQDDSIIIEEDRQSNQYFRFEAENVTLSVNSLLKTTKQRVQHSFLINTHSQIIAQEEERKLTFNEAIRETMHEELSHAKATKQDEKSGGLSESRVRKNACLKKKATLTIKDSSEASFQDDEVWQTKSYKKVVFKGNEDEQPEPKEPKQPKQSVEKMPRSPLKQHQNSKKINKRGESIVSICLIPKIQSRDETADANTSLKSSRTLHDLGSNHLIYRLKRTDKNGRQRACQSIEVQTIQEQRRESEVFALIKNHPHRNILKLYSMSKSIDIKTDRTILLQTIDFYPKNLEQYLIDLSQSEVSLEQVSIQRKIILFQILKGLNFLSTNKITHRNLNPFSVLINDSLETVISNFSSIDSPNLNSKTDLKCDWLIRPPQIILQPDFPYTYSGDIWQFGCLAVYMLKMNMPFVEYSDASLIIEMSKCIGRITADDRNAIGFKNFKKFIFPNLRRESMGRRFKCNDKDLVDMLRKVFVFNPYKRASAIELMKCRYFDELREGVRINDLFQFSREEIAEADREELFSLRRE